MITRIKGKDYYYHLLEMLPRYVIKSSFPSITTTSDQVWRLTLCRKEKGTKEDLQLVNEGGINQGYAQCIRFYSFLNLLYCPLTYLVTDKMDPRGAMHLTIQIAEEEEEMMTLIEFTQIGT